MSETIRDLTFQRLKVVEQELTARRGEIAALEDEEAQIRTIIKTMGYQMSGRPEPEGASTTAPNSAEGMTIKELATSVLEKHRDGLSVEAILAEVLQQYGVAVNETSLPPQLSRLKRAGVIYKEDGVWKLAQKSAGR